MDPPVRMRVQAAVPDARPDQWRVTWHIANDGPDTVWLDDAWVPHGRFKGLGGHAAVGEAITAGSGHQLTLRITCSEAAGTIVENAFLIVRLHDAERAWRLFARMRIEFDAQGTPRPVIETTTVQSIH